MSNRRIVILAGGQGARFWPLSRAQRPKQFLSIHNTGESLLQATVRRIRPILDGSEPWVVTNGVLEGLVREHVPDARVLCEPVGRDTAPCIGFSALYVALEDAEAVMVVLPADHDVQNEEILRDTLLVAVEAAEKSDSLVTVGIEPTHPHTGYGYIRCGDPVSPAVFEVERFYEKPNVERATSYVEAGDYLWNSGMFVFRARVILDAIAQHLPELSTGLQTIRQAVGNPERESTIGAIFSAFEPISIDFGVLEHARNCRVVRSKPFGWNDVGSWDAWAQSGKADEKGNLVCGDAVLLNTSNCVVHSEKRLTAVVGAEDLCIIDAGDALLVCPRDHVQDVKKVVEELKRRGRTGLI